MCVQWLRARLFGAKYVLGLLFCFSKVLLGMPAYTWYGYPYMYFDPRPKTRREDLYDRERELERFLSALPYASLIVITGLRRTGKTSFLNVALAESGHPCAVLDLRGLPYNPSRADIVRRLEDAFNKVDRKWFSGLCEGLRRLRGVSILGNAVSFEWGKKGVDLPELFGKVDAWASEKKRRFLMAFDEIQLVRGDKGIPRLFAHIVDSYRNLTLVVTGSEVGVLFDFLGFDDAGSPLYGRHFVQIHMGNFSASEAEEFLTLGFQQVGLAAPSEVIDYAVRNLDGVAGWLTLFGARCRDKHGCSKEIVDEVVSEGGKLAREEAVKLTVMSRRYGVILNFLAKVGSASWGEIKGVIEAKEKRSVTNSAVSNLLNTLVKVGVVEKADGKYGVVDALLVSGIRREALPE